MTREDEALISRKWAGPIAGAIGVFVTVATWIGSQVVDFDARLDRIESDLNHLIDKEGNSRPSNAAVKAMEDLRALEATVKAMQKWYPLPAKD